MYSIRMKLNDVIGKDEQVILENIRRCKQFTGHGFKVVFWNDGLSEKKCEEFVKRNEKMLFEISTKITSINSPFDNCWFLIKSDNKDKCKSRYSFKGDVLKGIIKYIEVVKHIRRIVNEDSDSRK